MERFQLFLGSIANFLEHKFIFYETLFWFSMERYKLFMGEINRLLVKSIHKVLAEVSILLKFLNFPQHSWIYTGGSYRFLPAFLQDSNNSSLRNFQHSLIPTDSSYCLSRGSCRIYSKVSLEFASRAPRGPKVPPLFNQWNRDTFYRSFSQHTYFSDVVAEFLFSFIIIQDSFRFSPISRNSFRCSSRDFFRLLLEFLPEFLQELFLGLRVLPRKSTGVVHDFFFQEHISEFLPQVLLA